MKLLDRLPLAIEIAASRVAMMSPQKILQRAGDRFRLLTFPGGRRDRQATLRATLDWSGELLPEDEQAALAQLSVFEGGFTLEVAEELLELEELWPVDAIQSLVNKSLVRPGEDDRFDLFGQRAGVCGGKAEGAWASERRQRVAKAIQELREAIEAPE